MSVKPPIKKRAPRTPKEKAFATEYIANGGNGTQAALKTYDVKDYHTASSVAAQNLSKLSIREHFEQIQGLRLSDRLLHIFNGLNADKRDQFTGEVVPDFNARFKHLELTFKLDGSITDVAKAVENENNFTVNVLTYNDNGPVQLPAEGLPDSPLPGA